MKPPVIFLGHPAWPALAQAAEQRLLQHGDYPRWQQSLLSLPSLAPDEVVFGDRVSAHGDLSADQAEQLHKGLMGLHPWRKGPFELFGIHIDTEWRSDWKWQRIATAIGSLSGQTVLDVGCGNGYFGWRAVAAGADQVLGVDPSVLFYLQHQAVSGYLDPAEKFHNALLPLPFEALPELSFDLVMSMGVVYHRPDPLGHVERLYRFTRPGGRLLLESLVVESDLDLRPAASAKGGGRYARMRNVSIVPTLETMTGWLQQAGFNAIETVDVSATSVEEQRSTAWMAFESLADSLDPEQPGRTVEGYPAPVRAAMLATKPC